MLPKAPHELTVAFIPTGGDQYENKDFITADRRALVKMNLTIVDIDLLTTKDKILEAILSCVDILFIAGGNVFYLLDKIRRSGFDIFAKKRNDLY